MKKLALMLVMALPLVMTACGDDEDNTPDLTLDQTSVSINYDGTATIKASEKNCQWSTDNDFVASVDNDGKIKANHVGTAVITATKDGAKATCRVTVNATNNNYTMPVLDWGATIAAVKAKVTGLQLYQETDNALSYTTNGTFPFYIYGFDASGLKASTLSISEEMDDQKGLDDYLEQYYQLVAENDDNFEFTYANAMTLEASTVSVVYKYDVASESVIATWTPTAHTRSGEAFVNKDFHNQHIQMVREFAKTIKK